MKAFNQMFTGVAVCAVAGLAALFPAQRASGALVLDLQNGATVINDNGAGDFSPTTGTIINSSTVAGFGVALTVGTSNSPGGGGGGLLQITSLNVTNVNNAGPATLVLKLYDDGFAVPGGVGTSIAFSSSLAATFSNGSTSDSVTFQSLADPSNSEPLSGGAVSTLPLTLTAATSQSSGSNFATFTRGSTDYSLEGIATITLSPGGQLNMSETTASGSLAVVPEPASLGLLALGGLSLLSRRRRAR